jgi:hypothetical protein
VLEIYFTADSFFFVKENEIWPPSRLRDNAQKRICPPEKTALFFTSRYEIGLQHQAE